MTNPTTDAQLLLDYARTGANAPFAAIVHRHINTIYSAARRQVHDPSLAEDITQAVFIVLARRAHKIHNPHLLAGWLLKVTRFCAADARKLATRRRHHEQKAAAMNKASATPDPTEPDITEHLDAHLATLSALDRTAITLRCLEERPLAEVAKELEISEEAAKKRVARALEKLRKSFTQKSIPLTAALLATTLAKQSLAAPPTLATTICTAAAAKTASTTTATLLTKGALKLLAWTSIKITTVAVAGVLIVAAGTAEVVHIAQSPATATTIAAAAPTAPPLDADISAIQSSASAYVYVMGSVRRPGVYKILPNVTPQELIRSSGLSEPLLRDGWVTVVRRVGPNFEHTITLPISTFIQGVNVPSGVRELEPNDVFNIGVEAPNPIPQSFEIGEVRILGNVQRAGGYDIFGKLMTTREAVSRFAKPQQPLDQLIVSVCRTKGNPIGEIVAQINLADVIAGKAEDRYVQPDDLLVVQMAAGDHFPPPASQPAPYVIIPADKPTTPGDNATYLVTGNTSKPGQYLLNGQQITVKMAIAAAAAQTATATLHRKVDNAPEKTISINLQAIFKGTEPDRFLQDGDVIDVNPPH